MVKTFCLLLTVMMLCFSNICTAANWTWVYSDDENNEYIDLDSIEAKIYAGEPIEASAWIKVVKSKTDKSYVAKLDFDYKNRMMHLRERRVDNVKRGTTEDFKYDNISLPITIRILNLSSDFYWYVKDKFTGRNESMLSRNYVGRLMETGTSVINGMEMHEYIDMMSIQVNNNLIQFDTLLFPKDANSHGVLAIQQYTRDGKRFRYKKVWMQPRAGGMLVEAPKANKEPFRDVLPGSRTELQFELVMQYYKDHPGNTGKNVLE